MPGMTRPATARPEEALLGRPRQAAVLTAGVVAVTAVVFALVADHGSLARIQRHPPRHHPRQAALSFVRLLRQTDGEGLSPPLESTAPHGALNGNRKLIS